MRLTRLTPKHTGRGTVCNMIRAATSDDLATLYAISPNDPGYFERCLDEKRLIVLASTEEGDCGCAMLTFNPRYSLYKKLGFPEIQDVAVIAAYRQRGLATKMIGYLETAAREEGYQGIGISVGLTKDYGPAQRLYAKLGYLPDGFGVTYDREAATAGQTYRLDDDLCLMLVKEF